MSTYPDIPVGPLTADLLRRMLPTYIVKAGATSRPSSTALDPDPDLVLPVEANGVYEIEMKLTMSAYDAADIKTSWSVPAGTTGNRRIIGPSTVALDANADNITMRSGTHATTGTVVYNGVRNGTNQFSVIEFGLITIGGTAGSITLLWGQNATSVNPSIVAGTSYIKATRVA